MVRNTCLVAISGSIRNPTRNFLSFETGKGVFSYVKLAGDFWTAPRGDWITWNRPRVRSWTFWSLHLMSGSINHQKLRFDKLTLCNEGSVKPKKEVPENSGLGKAEGKQWKAPPDPFLHALPRTSLTMGVKPWELGWKNKWLSRLWVTGLDKKDAYLRANLMTPNPCVFQIANLQSHR